MRENKFYFEDLEVYQKSIDLSEKAIKTVSKFPYQYSRIRDQFIGAFLSIPLNIAEGCGRYHKKDKIRFYLFARGSAFETIPILEICRRLNLISCVQVDNFRKETLSLSKMLSALISSQKDRP